MAWLFEDSTYVLVLGGLAELFLGVAFFRTGLTKFLGAMAGVAAVVVSLCLVEVLVVTDKERVADTLSDLAAVLGSDKPEKAVDFLAPQAQNFRGELLGVLKQFRLSRVKVSNVTVVMGRDGQSATATFLGGADVTGTDEMDVGRQMRKLSVDLMQDGDRWLLVSYRVLPLTGSQRANTDRRLSDPY